MRHRLGASKPKKKRSAWTGAGEAAILDLWSIRIADLRSARKNGHIYADMANELKKLGHYYSARDVQVKVANFTQRYRKEKLGMRSSGGLPSTWPFFKRVHQIISGFKTNTFDGLTINNMSQFDNASRPSSPTRLSSPLPSMSSLPSPSPPPISPSPSMKSTSAAAKDPKKKGMGVQKKMLEKFEEISTEISLHIENNEEIEKEMLQIEKEKIETLKQIAKENRELKNAILSFLNRNM